MTIVRYPVHEKEGNAYGCGKDLWNKRSGKLLMKHGTNSLNKEPNECMKKKSKKPPHH